MTRQPQQERAKKTAQAIVEAGFIAVARHGAQRSTMRQIADIAGVGVASLYEYFDNKEAIFTVMGERLSAEITAMIKRITPQLVRISITQAIYELILAFAELLRKNDSCYLKCANQGLFLNQPDELVPIYKALIELFSQHTMYHPEHLQLKRIGTMTYIFLNSGVFTMLRFMSNPSPHFSFEELAQGMADMVGHYVARELELTKPPSESPA
jgi:AcrR family transcriptional regulator